MSNFKFLHSYFPNLYAEAKEAELLTYSSPKASCIISRSALEKAVIWLYDNEPDLHQPYDNTLSSLLHDSSFKELIGYELFREVNLIRKIGNNAAHGSRIKPDESLTCIKYLFRFMKYLGLHYDPQKQKSEPFNEGLIPKPNAEAESKRQVDLLLKKLTSENEKLKYEQKELNQQIEENEKLQNKRLEEKKKVKILRENREKEIPKNANPLLVSEAKTRKLYIDQLLKESGWQNLKQHKDLEYEVTGMPSSTNPSGKGFVDYVLWDDNGKPLAVVEAKKAMVSPAKGKHQAVLYANCLEKMHGQRPIIYYTNGFETFIWDDNFYPSRKVNGFQTKDELQLSIQRRTSRKDIREFTPNKDITGRYYQLEAIQRVAEAFVTNSPKGKITGKGRQALLVMATGSGKTRTAISIVDMLSKCNWVKKVLFLADRNALVSQAKRNFNEHLPHLSAIDLTKEKEAANTRLVFSTYPTIMNKIDSAKTEDYRFYGPGHFDLIIIDEAHRSIYAKYKAIFEYFDSLLVGLTATPKKDIDRNTYTLFDIEDDNPTYAYELNQAVKDNFLVPPKSFSIPIKFPRDGIKYSELSEEEKKEYEEKFGDPEEGVPDFIGGEALNKWLFNKDTVDKALQYLMEKGIRVEGGDKLGKTIIFAKNHNHAIFIEERFNKNYPEYNGNFLRVIDNQESKAQDMLEVFCDEHQEKDPQIAVSVDMMDTGVDAPRVVNLMFFKIVRSHTKFWQMIGRGTRLCPNLFGPEQNKTHFQIFDLCGNFDFFEEYPDGAPGFGSISLTQKTFKLKVEILYALRETSNPSDEDLALADLYAENLRKQIVAFDQERFMVRQKLKYVLKYSDAKNWENLSHTDTIEIINELSALAIPNKDDHELARRFDVLMLILSLSRLMGKDVSKYVTNVITVSNALHKKRNIPAIEAKIGLIKVVSTDAFWQNVNAKRLEEIREGLRDLIKFLDRTNQEIVYTNFKDEIQLSEVKEKEILGYATQAKPYKERVETYLRKNKNHITIHKLRNNQPINKEEIQALEDILFDESTVGSKEEYENTFGNKPLGVFIRNILGMELNAAKEAFADFIRAGNLTGDQITFIDNIIMFFEKNGVVSVDMLFKPPFTNANENGLLGVFEEGEAITIRNIVNTVNNNAEVA